MVFGAATARRTATLSKGRTANNRRRLITFCGPGKAGDGRGSHILRTLTHFFVHSDNLPPGTQLRSFSFMSPAALGPVARCTKECACTASAHLACQARQNVMNYSSRPICLLENHGAYTNACSRGREVTTLLCCKRRHATVASTEEEEVDTTGFWVQTSEQDLGGAENPNLDRTALDQETERLLGAFNDDSAQQQPPKAQPQLVDYHRVIHSWAKVIEQDDITTTQEDALEAATKAQSLLDHVHKCYDEKSVASLQPTAVTYNVTMLAWARSSRYLGKLGAQNAEKVMQSMIDRFITHMQKHAGESPYPPSPTTSSFNTLLDSWAKLVNVDSGRNAENIMKWMDTWYLPSGSDETARAKVEASHQELRVTPDVRSLNSVIEAWGNSCSNSFDSGGADMYYGANRAQTILDAMIAEMQSREGLSGTTNKDVRGAIPSPNPVTFSSVIHAWCKCAAAGGGISAAENAEQVLNLIESVGGGMDPPIRPDTDTFNAVLGAWSKLGEDGAPERAEAILLRMEELHARGYGVMPNRKSFTTVIEAWVNGGGKSAPFRADKLLARMQELHRLGEADFTPTVETFNVVLNAWAKSKTPGATQKAENILRQMESFGATSGSEAMRPDVSSYNTVISALARAQGKNQAERAERILKRMKASVIQALRPDTITYNAAIDAFAKSKDKDAAEKAEALLADMEDLSRDDKSQVRPNAISFTSTIDSYAWSHDPKKPDKARSLLARMTALYHAGNVDCKPDVFAYTSVVKVCAYTRGRYEDRRRALRVAIQTFEELQESSFGDPNNATYLSLIRGIFYLTADNVERHKLLEGVFRQCCEDGYLDQNILDQIQKATNRKLLRKLLGGVTSGGKVHIDQLSRQWSRNVPKMPFRAKGSRRSF